MAIKGLGTTSTVADRMKQAKLPHIVMGIVVNNCHPTGAACVEVRLPTSEGGGDDDPAQQKTAWIRVSSFYAGEHIGDDASQGSRGAMFLPHVGDEVVCAFENGDIGRGVALGCVWSDVGADKTIAGSDDGAPNRPIYSQSTTQKGRLAGPADNDPSIKTTNTKTKHEKNKNDLSGIVTRSGHTITFNDNASEPAIYIRSSKGHRIELIDAGNKGILISDPQENYIWLKSGSQGNDIEVNTKGNIKLTSRQGDITLEATQGAVNITSKLDTTITASSNFNATGDKGMRLHSNQSAEVSASQHLMLKGSQKVNIN